ncbi:MAG: type III-A CRISPR-associated protein Csm2 [Archaeoglobaceae archaeon]|nr:type III-A CRISPR-associated protein Csm2 [Archaeoglobaceae archaeon]MCX8152681.1 type III-A CRISPR-associated protein Csm2 [Archaeoglobaceae archaeon]
MIERIEDLKKILEDPRELERVAEEFGKKLSKKERQVRELYVTVLKSKDLSMIKPRVYYQSTRHEELKELAELVAKLVDVIRGSKNEVYRKSLLNFLEAVVAYARYYEKHETRRIS